MPSVLAYHRPGSLAEASTLLAGPNRRIAAGGTLVVPHSRMQRGAGVEIVDLQALGLDTIEAFDDFVLLGAMARLGELVSSPKIPGLIADLARRELPSALRNQATVGGTVGAAEADSVLLAGLLVHGAEVEFHDGEAQDLPTCLSEGLGGRIVTSVSIATGGAGAIAVTGRTPADTPIVAAVARSGSDGLVLALTGVAETPVLADPSDPTAGLQPPADFRGSSDYRLHLAAVLSIRALEELR